MAYPVAITENTKIPSNKTAMKKESMMILIRLVDQGLI